MCRKIVFLNIAVRIIRTAFYCPRTESVALDRIMWFADNNPAPSQAEGVSRIGTSLVGRSARPCGLWGRGIIGLVYCPVT
ncbi:MAG: hypothetical protein UX89_C0025G0011 [Parcubacteria group bacterium GW2011_GWA2_47_16]|nr:MAG: hypothetical protein UX89_C0025G0011 [Parcubacteria group bacterium GW2011_GWA2_47_16]